LESLLDQSSIYGFLLGAWAFGLVEGIWSANSGQEMVDCPA
jgi:hypothetical protein